MTAPSTPPDDTKAIREECEGLARAWWPIADARVRVVTSSAPRKSGDWSASVLTLEAYGHSEYVRHSCEGPTEHAALLALRAALETACDEALERLAKVRGKVVSEDVDALRARMARVDWTPPLLAGGSTGGKHPDGCDCASCGIETGGAK